MKLSHRLLTVASFVRKGSNLADIGTDHGYIPIYLAENGTIRSAVAMDIRKGPLERAKNHIKLHKLEDQIKTRLSDGLLELTPGEADTAVIAGMGGDLVIEILDRGRHVWNSVGQWILSPQSDLFRVRVFLEKNGFVIEDEVMVQEDGKYYTIISAARIPQTEEGVLAKPYEKPQYYRFGWYLIKKKSPILMVFLEKEKHKLQTVLSRLEEQDTETVRERKKELTQELRIIQEAQDEMQ